jgi:predicted SnoaL-like aldol condensation-catalyzing enzyme
MTVEENKAVVARFQNEVQNGRRFDLIDEVVHPDYVLNDGDVRGRESARIAFVDMMRNPKAHFKIIDVVGEGDKVVTRWEATSDGENLWKGITIFRLVDGKIIDDFYCANEIKPK